MKKRYLLAAPAPALLSLLVASGASPAPAVSAPTASIVISGFAYSGDLTVSSGEEVTVTNTDPAVVLHTLTDKQTLLFDTGPITGGGGTGTFTAPTQPGSYPFGCSFHLLMMGTLVVHD